MKLVLVENRDAVLKEGLQLYKKTENDLKNDIKILRKWSQTQKHLPEIPSNNMIMNFLFLNKFSIELTKEKLDMFYTIRDLLPEIFRNKHPSLQCMKDTNEAVRVFVLPKLMPNARRVGIIQIKNKDPEKLELYNFLGSLVNMGVIRFEEDILKGDVLIFDLKYFTAKHLTKLHPLGMKKGALLLEKVFSNRIAQIHFINFPTYAGVIVDFVKSIIKQKIANRIQIHKDPERLADFIPLTVLPSDFGGEELSLTELEVLWQTKIEEYYDRFDTLEKMKVNESLRPTPLVNDDILGFYGNFKSLSVD